MCLEALLLRLGYVRIPNAAERIAALTAKLKLSTDHLHKAVEKNKPKPK